LFCALPIVNVSVATLACAPGRVRLLNPGCSDDDSTARRFAYLEVD